MLLLLIFFLTSSPSFSLSNYPSIEGVITNFDEHNVTLMTEGRKMVVPRNQFDKDQKIRSGKRVTVFLNPQILKKELKNHKPNKFQK
jgi:hypothetical protein